MSQVGISGQYQLPNYIAQVLLDHNKTVHDVLGLDHAQLSNYVTCAVRAYRTGNQTISTGTVTKILFNDEDFDIGGDFRGDGANSNFLVPTTDYYFILGQIRMDNLVANNDVFLTLHDDGGLIVRESQQGQGGGVQALTLITVEYLTLNHLIDLRIEQDSGGDKILKEGRDKSFFIIRRIGA